MAEDNPSEHSEKLSIGLVVDCNYSSKYVYELAKWGRTQSDLRITHLIIVGTTKNQTPRMGSSFPTDWSRRLLSIPGKFFYAWIVHLESFVLSRSKNHKEHLNTYRLTDIVGDSLSISPIHTGPDSSQLFSNQDATLVQRLNLDVLLWLGSGLPVGEILKSSRLGTISVRHSDDRLTQGGPAGFWEVFLKQDSTGFTIHQPTGQPDGGKVLFRGRFGTKRLYLLNQALILERSAFYLKKFLKEIASSRTMPHALERIPYCNQYRQAPTSIESLRYLGQSLTTITRQLLNRLWLRKDFRWSVAFFKEDWKSLEMWRATRIPNPPNHFLADPFVVSRNSESYCFVEDYDYLAARGRISVYRLSEHSAERFGDAIVEPFHMSFPYIFEFESKIYMCPETSENRDIRIYECTRFPLEWKLAKVAMSDVSAADTMIFERDGLWWLFTNLDSSNSGDHCSELFIYYSDSPLSDVWNSHSANPVFVDATRARNAGLLRDDKSIYRVSQRQGFDMYGKGSSINEILVLNKDEYLERVSVSIEPDFFKGLSGTHHLHSNGIFSAFDCVEFVSINS